MTEAEVEAVRMVAFSGGVGGAKLVKGLAAVVPAGRLMVVTNTGDDFEHLGLHVSPDTDTVFYTLAGLADAERGWGRADESWNFLAALEELGGETWFRLGDRDLALHVLRTARMEAGERLSEITADLCRRADIPHHIVPMSNDPVRTVVSTPDGDLAFQRYFVEARCEPVVTGISFAGAESARPAPELLQALASPHLEAVILCPSNPLVSLDPVFAVPGLRQAVLRSSAPVIGVSPIVGGRALKGPADKMMKELGMEASAAGVARHFADILDIFVVDEADASSAGEIADLGLKVVVAPTVMQSDADKTALARRLREAVAQAKDASNPIGSGVRHVGGDSG